MQLQQKRTFLPYLRGIPPEALRLGSLYINPLEPNDGLASRRFEYRRDIEEQEDYEAEVKKFCWKVENDAPFSIDFETSKGGSLGLSFTEFLHVSGEQSKTVLVTIQGQSGRRMKIRDPETFLEEVVNQENVDQWIRKHASITHKSRFGRNRWKAPELWMVTGVQYVTGGEVHFEGSSSSRIAGEGGGDAGPAAGLPPGVLKAKAEGSYDKSNGAKNDFGHEDERVWAAQFMPVTIEFGPGEDTELTGRIGKPQPKTIRQFKLEDVPDLKARGIRASEEKSDQVGPVPKLIGRVTAQPTKEQVTAQPTTEHDTEADPEGIVIDDRNYLTVVQEADWETYEAYRKIVSDTQRSRERRGDSLSI